MKKKIPIPHLYYLRAIKLSSVRISKGIKKKIVGSIKEYDWYYPGIVVPLSVLLTELKHLQNQRMFEKDKEFWAILNDQVKEVQAAIAMCRENQIKYLIL